MSVEFKKFIEEKAKEKEELKKDNELIEQKSFLRSLRDDFYKVFPELRDSKWKLDGNILGRDKFELLIDELTFIVSRSTSGYGPVYQYQLKPFCHECFAKQNFEGPYCNGILSLKEELDKKFTCAKCDQ